MEVKIGDTVHVKGTVADIKNGVTVCIGPFHIPYADPLIVHVEPQRLKVGDMVWSRNGSSGKLLAIDGDSAWVRFACGPSTVSIAALERA